MKYYICDKCKFQFMRADEPEHCPDCGKEAVRQADEKEKADFLKLLEEKKRWKQ